MKQIYKQQKSIKRLKQCVSFILTMIMTLTFVGVVGVVPAFAADNVVWVGGKYSKATYTIDQANLNDGYVTVTIDWRTDYETNSNLGMYYRCLDSLYFNISTRQQDTGEWIEDEYYPSLPENYSGKVITVDVPLSRYGEIYIYGHGYLYNTSNQRLRLYAEGREKIEYYSQEERDKIYAPESVGIEKMTDRYYDDNGGLHVVSGFDICLGNCQQASDGVYIVDTYNPRFYCIASEREPQQLDLYDENDNLILSAQMNYVNDNRWEIGFSQYEAITKKYPQNAKKAVFHPVKSDDEKYCITINIDTPATAGVSNVSVEMSDKTNYLYYSKVSVEGKFANVFGTFVLRGSAGQCDARGRAIKIDQSHTIVSGYVATDNYYYGEYSQNGVEEPTFRGGWAKTPIVSDDMWSTPVDYSYVRQGSRIKTSFYVNENTLSATACLVYINTNDEEVTLKRDYPNVSAGTLTAEFTVPNDAKQLTSFDCYGYYTHGLYTLNSTKLENCYCSNFIEFTNVPDSLCAGMKNLDGYYRGYEKPLPRDRTGRQRDIYMTITDSKGTKIRTYLCNTKRILYLNGEAQGYRTVGGTIPGLASGPCTYEITVNDRHFQSGTFNVTGELGQKVSLGADGLNVLAECDWEVRGTVATKAANDGTVVRGTVLVDVTTPDGVTSAYSFQNDNDKSYAFQYMPKNSQYKVSYSYDADNYPYIKGANINGLNVSLESFAKRSVTGTIVNANDNQPVAYANVIISQAVTRLDGSAYTLKTIATTDDKGKFTIENAYSGVSGSVEIRAKGYNVAYTELSASTSNLGTISLDYYGSYSIIPSLKKEPVKLIGTDGGAAKDSNGKVIGNEMGDNLLDADTALIQVDTIEINGTKYQRDKDWFESVEGGQSIINFKNVSILSRAAAGGSSVTVHYKKPANGMLEVAGENMTLRSWDVTSRFDENNVLLAQTVAYKPEGKIRVTAAAPDSEGVMGYAVLSDGNVSYKDDNGNTQQDINVVSWAGGKGELALSYSMSGYNAGKSYKLYTFNVSEKDAKTMTQMLKNGRPKLSTASNAVVTTDVKLVENSIIAAGVKTSTKTYSDISMGAYTFDYVLLPYENDAGLVELRGVLSKRDIQSKDTLLSASTNNGSGLVVNGEKSAEDGKWYNKVLSSGKLKNIVSAPVYALVPYKQGTSEIDFTFKVSYQNNDTGSKSSDVYKINEEILNFDITVPENVSMTNEMAKNGWKQSKSFIPWTLDATIAAYKSADERENVITVWDNGAAIAKFDAAELSGATVRALTLTDMHNPGTHTIYATREKKEGNGYVTITTPKKYTFVSASQKDVYASDYVWYHNGKVAHMNSGRVSINPSVGSVIKFTVYGATSSDIDGVRVSGPSFSKSAQHLYDDTSANKSYWMVADGNYNAKDYVNGYGPVKDKELLKLASKQGIMTGTSSDLNVSIEFTLPGISTENRETLREQAFRSYYDLRGLNVPDNDDRIEMLQNLTDAQLEEYVSQEKEDLPKAIAELKYTQSVSGNGKIYTYTAAPTATIPKASLVVDMSDNNEYLLYELYNTLELERAGQSDDEGYEIHWTQADSAQGYTLERTAVKSEEVMVNGRKQYHTIIKKTVYMPSEVRDALYSAAGVNTIKAYTANVEDMGSVALMAASSADENNTPAALAGTKTQTKAKTDDKGDPFLKKAYDVVNDAYSIVDIHNTLQATAKVCELKRAGVVDPEVLKLAEKGYIPDAVGNVANVLSVVDYAYTVSQGPSGKSGDDLWEMLMQVGDQNARMSFARDILDYENLRADSYELDCYLKGATGIGGLFLNNPACKIGLFLGGKAYDKIRGWADEYQSDTFNTIRKSIEDQVRAENYKKEYAAAKSEIEARLRKTFGRSMSQKALQEEINKYWVLTKENGKLKYVFHTKVPKDRIYIDPSGYVFEATEENRVGGVTATLYKSNDDGEFEEPWVDPIEEDAQENPQITAYGEGDLGGRYGWMVPSGDWMIKFHDEEGRYFDSQTNIIQVPPEHTNVNIGLLSTEAPKVKVETKGGKVYLTFSKYMRMDTLVNAGASKTVNLNASGVQTGTTDTSTSYDDESFDSGRFAVGIFGANGGQLQGTVSFPDKVANTGYTFDSPYQTDIINCDYFVKTAVFTPNDSVDLKGVTTQFGEGILSYSGVALLTETEAIYTSELTVKKISSALNDVTYSAALNTGEKCVMIAVSYNRDGTVYDIKAAYTNNGNADVTVNVPYSSARVIIMAWDSLSGMRPMAKTKVAQ